jgi:hypothetical protein
MDPHYVVRRIQSEARSAIGQVFEGRPGQNEVRGSANEACGSLWASTVRMRPVVGLRQLISRAGRNAYCGAFSIA